MGRSIAARLNDEEEEQFDKIRKEYNEDPEKNALSISDALHMMIEDEYNLLLFKHEYLLNSDSILTEDLFDIKRYRKLLDKPLSLFSKGISWEDKDNLKKILMISIDVNDQYNAILRELTKAQTDLNEDQSKKLAVNAKLLKQLSNLEESVKETNVKMDKLLRMKVN